MQIQIYINAHFLSFCKRNAGIKAEDLFQTRKNK